MNLHKYSMMKKTTTTKSSYPHPKEALGDLYILTMTHGEEEGKILDWNTLNNSSNYACYNVNTIHCTVVHNK